MEISSRVEGFDSVEIGMRGAPRRLREQMVESLSEAANIAEDIMSENVPEHSGRLRETIRVTPIRYTPGGAGGGGEWTTSVTAGEGIFYFRYLTEGTGIHGPTGSLIRPRTKKYMVWTDYSGTHFRRTVRGQKPQTDWIQFAQYAADVYLRNAIEHFDL